MQDNRLKLYKLTNEQGETYNHTQWGEGVEHTASGYGELCRPGWLHAYTHPLLAVLLNPIHANVVNPILWECEGTVGKTDHGLKVGCTQLRTLRKMTLPEVSNIQKIVFGILCAKEVCKNQEWNMWADRWLSGKDRTETAARAAESAARAAQSAAWAAQSAAWVEQSAARAAASAVWAAAESAVESVAQSAAWVAQSAARAAESAARAVASAVEKTIDFISLAEKAMQYK